MRGVLLGIFIFLLCSAVFIGAANSVFGTNNRPYTLYEFVQEVSRLDFGFDNITNMIDNIESIWDKSRAHLGGIGGRFDKEDTTDFDIIDFVESIYNVFLSLYEIIVFVFNFVFDILTLVVDILQLAMNFIIGKPTAA